ncbi:MAG TPA: GAF and ANTAR domain-containing protein [Amycolatopsis sp.]|nr:GAF and ANTAR domain-containing protein [Amycolatopsis sp.]
MARDLPSALLELTDTSDVVDLDGYADRLAHWSVELTPVTGAAVVLRDETGALRVGAARPGWIRVLPEFSIAGGEGLAAECFDRAEPVSVSDVSERKWPRYREIAERLGIHGGHAIPLGRSGRLSGALTVYYGTTDGDRTGVAEVCCALAHAAAIGLANLAEYRRLRLLAQQLQTALESRIVIEQAKGILAERMRTDIDQAFAILRRFAREHNLRLHDVARTTVETRKAPQ